jgi:hypothetical protein
MLYKLDRSHHKQTLWDNLLGVTNVPKGLWQPMQQQKHKKQKSSPIASSPASHTHEYRLLFCGSL